MHWCLSEFLNLMEVRGQCWCLVDLGADSAFQMPAGDTLSFYAMIDGTARLFGSKDGPVTLESGDVVMLLSGDAHAIRTHGHAVVETIPFLADALHADSPPTYTLGSGAPAARMLCGRLRLRLPGGVGATMLPEKAVIPAGDSLLNLPALIGAATGTGGTSVLTRAAALLLTTALRDDPDCQTMFRDASYRDPIGRAVQYLEVHPFREWTVAGLARKVGMGRSSFAARFLIEVGKSPMELLTDIRMTLAATLLTETRLKVGEIGERVGYRSESAFSRRFMAYYKATPGQMRHNHPPTGADA